jgi:DNA-binding transcriptional ArsR family regulator
MASTVDMLQSTLGDSAYSALKVLADSPKALSGRQVATVLGVAPTTSTSALGRLRDAGFALSSREGRAVRWHLNADHSVVRAWLKEVRGEGSSSKAPEGMSPYATGGGGVTFERKVAVQYLAHLLLGDGAPELGDSRCVVSLAFQQAPEHSVDDLVIRAAREDELEPSLVLAVAVRRAPNLVQSDEASKKLIRSFVQEIVNAPVEGPEHRVVLVVAGVQDHAKQLETLAGLASDQMDSESFFALVGTPGRFAGDIRVRLEQVEGLVELAVQHIGVTESGGQNVKQRTWELLSRLTVLMPRLEAPDEADWGAIANALIPVARGADLYGASRLRDRLVALAAEYPQNAASVDRSLLRRHAHEALDSTARRHQQGWQALAHLHSRATTSVRNEIASADRSRVIHVDRRDTSVDLLAAIVESSPSAVVAHGDSGVGKSALVIQTATDAATSDPDGTQALCINLRHLPRTTLELESYLGAPLATLLAELGAPRRLLVIDGADALTEGMGDPLRYIVDAAVEADIVVVAVTANETRQLLRDTIDERTSRTVIEFPVPPLTDTDVDTVVTIFDELAPLAANPRSRELLRRPVVVDLLVRGGLSGTPLSDADAMEQVWSGLVRRHGQSDHGTPEARDIALVHLANLALCGGDALTVMSEIDPTALDGLRRDGVLRTSDDPWSIGPEFAHDELRRYAIARLLLMPGNFTAKLFEGGVPRWSLAAARLACQVVLSSADTPTNPLRDRFARVQKVFNDIVDAGHGERWGDVPGEALLTLGDPDPVLRDAWADLRVDSGAGLQRLARLVDQRLRAENGVVRQHAVEPLVALVLDDEMPWSAEYLQDILREWLRALVISDAPVAHPLRIRLRDRLVAACAAADLRLQQERDAAAAARATRTAEEIEEERQFRERHNLLFTEIGYPRSRPRRTRQEVPQEMTAEIVVELFALLGPDLGEDGEAILRRIAADAPAWLCPAVEELLTGRALAGYRRGFLAEMTESYYIDDEEDASGFDEDGIRDHHARSFGIIPLAAWYRGPFMPVFQTDFRNGVAVLNRMLNHAALARARTLAGHQHYGAVIDDSALDAYRTQLEITGARRVYVGDGNVWMWYRGTGVGPYPCMSALQALERVCDQLIAAGIPLANIVAILLDGCESLAMVALVVGMLVRHLDDADRLLDPYLSEPVVWHQEFGRMVHENSGLAASSDGIAHAERRQWSLREAAMLLVLRADESRTEEMRAIGERLVDTYRGWVVEALGDGAGEDEVENRLVTVRSWASGLDRDTYEAKEAEGGLYIQSRPPEDVAQALETGNEDLRRAQEATRLMVRYHVHPRQGLLETLAADDLVSDLAVAKDLLENPPALNPTGLWDIPAAVAASALEAHLVDGMVLPDESLRLAIDVVLRVGLGEPLPRQYEFEESYFEQGGDRSVARALPLLLLPSAATLRASVDGKDGSQTFEKAASAALNLARGEVREVRVQLARGLDRLWATPCATNGPCHHDIGLQIAIESMRDCVFGNWNPEIGRRQINQLSDPVEHALAATADKDIYFSRLDGAIRALAPAAMAGICVSRRAHELLVVLLEAHRRALLSYDRDMDSRGTHALIAARAVLTVTAEGDDGPMHQHIDAYADNSTLLNTFLRAVSAAGEESPGRAETAARVWPSVVAQVIGMNETGHTPFEGRHYGDYALATLLPNTAGEVSYLYRELEGDPIAWWQPVAWDATVETWLSLAEGNATCVDHLIGFIRPLTVEDQVRLGLPWVATLVLPNPSQIASRSFLVSSWLIEVRQTASDEGMLPNWQRVVDALVVAGTSRLAPYSE